MSNIRLTKEQYAALLREGTDKKVSTKKPANYRTKQYGRNAEDKLIDAIDNKNQIGRFLEFQEKVRKGLIDPGQLFTGMAPEVALELLKVALNGESERSRLEAMKDVLDRAGYGKINKHAIASVDPNSSKEALVSLILGAQKDLEKSGVEILDDEDKNEVD